jgi:hypothetical protein
MGGRPAKAATNHNGKREKFVRSPLGINIIMCNTYEVEPGKYFLQSLGEPKKFSYRAWDYVELPMKEVRRNENEVIEATCTFYFKMTFVPSGWATGIDPRASLYIVFVDFALPDEEIENLLRLHLCQVDRFSQGKILCVYDCSANYQENDAAAKLVKLLTEMIAKEYIEAEDKDRVCSVPRDLDELVHALALLERAHRERANRASDYGD